MVKLLFVNYLQFSNLQMKLAWLQDLMMKDNSIFENKITHY